MFKKIIPIAWRNFPIIYKTVAFTFSFALLKYHTKLFSPINCTNFPLFSGNNALSQVLPKIIRVQHNGQIVGYAYCLSDNLVVTTSHQLLINKNKANQFQFYIGQQKIITKVKLIGSFQQFTFFETQNNLLPVLPAKNVALYSPIQVIYNKNYLSIRNGYYVANQSGYGILDARGEIGSLVLNQNGIMGIVTHIGRDQDQGFIRIAHWNDIKNVAHRLKRNQKGQIHLGISVVTSTSQEGLTIIRVTSTSPLISHLRMGDVITKVNNQPVKNPQDLPRIIMFSQNKVNFEVQSNDKTKRHFTVQL